MAVEMIVQKFPTLIKNISLCFGISHVIKELVCPKPWIAEFLEETRKGRWNLPGPPSCKFHLGGVGSRQEEHRLLTCSFSNNIDLPFGDVHRELWWRAKKAKLAQVGRVVVGPE